MRKPIRKEVFAVAIVCFVGSLLAMLAFLLSGSADAYTLVLMIAAGITAAWVIRTALVSNQNAYRAKVERDEFISFLGRAVYRVRSGEAYSKALWASAKEIADGRIRAKVTASLRKREMCDVSGVLSSARQAMAHIGRDRRRREAAQAEMDNSAQRYATFAMFISTVLPSFLVFAFIGSSIISNSPFGLQFFSIALILFVPAAYSVFGSLMWRRLFA